MSKRSKPERSYRDTAPPKNGLLGTGSLKTPLTITSGKIGLICEWCNMQFETYACWAKRKNHHFCSKACSDEWHKIPVEKCCVICGEKFITTPFNAKRLVTCSRKCFVAKQTKQFIEIRKNIVSAKGEQVHGSKLCDENIPAIRKDPRPYGDIANEYEISRSLVCRIKKRKAWKHVEDSP